MGIYGIKGKREREREKGRKWEKNGEIGAPRIVAEVFKDGKNCVPREKSKQLVEIIKRLVTVIELKLS